MRLLLKLPFPNLSTEDKAQQFKFKVCVSAQNNYLITRKFATPASRDPLPVSKGVLVSVTKTKQGCHLVTLKPDHVGRYSVEVTVNGKPMEVLSLLMSMMTL